MLGQVQDISFTSSGHYAVSLNEKKQILEDVTRKGASTTLNVQDLSEDKMEDCIQSALPILAPTPK